MSDTVDIVLIICGAVVVGLALKFGRRLLIHTKLGDLSTGGAEPAKGASQSMEAKGGGSIVGAVQVSAGGGAGPEQRMNASSEGKLENVRQIDRPKAGS